MKKILTSIVVAALGAAVVAVIKLKKKKEDGVELVEIQEEFIPLKEYPMHEIFEYCPEDLIDSLKNECRLKMERFADNEKVVLRHFVRFATQDDLFSSVKEVKGLEYMLEEVNEDRTVILTKTVNNYFEDVFAQICGVANLTRKYHGDYQGFKLDQED